MRLRLVATVVLMLPLAASAEQRGRAVFAAHCVSCHGESGNGKGHATGKLKPADLRSSAVQALTDAELFESIAHGTGHKQYPHTFADRGLSEADVKDVVAYIRTLARPAAKNHATGPSQR